MFIVLGLLGAGLLLLFLLGGDSFEQLLPENDWISGPVIGAFLAAFGIVGWTVSSGLGTSTAVASLAGVGGGVALGCFGYWLTRVMADMPTDATPTSADLVGLTGRIVTPIAGPGAGTVGVGEVLVSVAGQPRKLTAESTATLLTGTEVVVVTVVSPTRVVVESAAEFWGR